MVFFVGVEGFVSKRPAKLIRGFDIELVLPAADSCSHFGDAVEKFLDSVVVISKTYCLLYHLPPVRGSTSATASTVSLAKESSILLASLMLAISRSNEPRWRQPGIEH